MWKWVWAHWWDFIAVGLILCLCASIYILIS